MATQMHPIIIIGAGPTGLLLSALLSHHYHIPHLVIEQRTTINPDPRAFSLSEYGIRYLQMVGLYNSVYTKMGQAMHELRFMGGREQRLDKGAFLRMNVRKVGTTGHERFLLFSQPVMEGELRGLVEREKFGEVRVGCEVVGVEDDGDGVMVRYVRDGEEVRLRAAFVVGCDGKRGFVRKRYLEEKGVRMESTHAFKKDYVGGNWDVSAPTREANPEFVLWEKDWSSEEVMDKFMPKSFNVMCHPVRDCVMSRAGPWRGNGAKLWRAEFALLPGDDREDMARHEKLNELMRPYMTHEGHRYGLSEDVQFPSDCMKLRRSWHYRTEARMCNEWYKGRVLLAGDAAHVFPPFGGQGLTAGFFDVVGLAWRLSLALAPSNSSKDVSTLFESWQRERKAHIQQALEYTMKIGAILEERNALKVFVRDWLLWFLQLIPLLREIIQEQPIEAPRYDYTDGMAFLPDLGGGRAFFQIYCRKLHDPKIMFSDSVVFSARKKSLFQLVVLTGSVEHARSEYATLKHLAVREQNWSDIIQESTLIVHDLEATLSDVKDWAQDQVVRPATTEEFSGSSLCEGRAKPSGYDPFLLQKQHPHKTYIVVRPDIFTFAACADTTELLAALGEMDKFLEMRTNQHDAGL